MVNKMIHSESLDQIATALAIAQGEIENASKNSNNPHFRSKYADLAEILNTVRPVFAKHGIAVVQSPSYADGIVSVTTTMMHKSGQYLSDTCYAPATKLDPQGVGSAITYLRRYSLAAFAGIAQEDDDGNAASRWQAPAAPSMQMMETAADKLRACKSLDELKKAYAGLSPELRQSLNGLKDNLKEQLS